MCMCQCAASNGKIRSLDIRITVKDRRVRCSSIMARKGSKGIFRCDVRTHMEDLPSYRVEAKAISLSGWVSLR